MKIKRLKPGMLFITPLENGVKAFGLLVSRNGRRWNVWVSSIEDGRAREPYMMTVDGAYIRDDWLNKHKYEFYL